MLLVAALLILAAFGAAAPDLPPSAQRVLVTSVVGLLAPLFWPGIAATPARTALCIAAWSAAAACLAAFVLKVFGHPAQSFARILWSCMMLMFILLLTHAAAAGLEWRLRIRSGHAGSAREMAGRSLAFALALVGSLPLWLGPVGELLSRRHDGVLDAIVGMSPLSHLAVASDNDLLRNQWLYQHSNLAALPVSYPGLTELAWAYGAACLLLTLITLAFQFRRQPYADAGPTRSTTEKT
jgi:hypothetical protein